MTQYPNPLEGKNVPVVTFFHFHRNNSGRTYLVQPLHRTDFCKTDHCRFLLAAGVEILSADKVLGLEPTIRGWEEMANARA